MAESNFKKLERKLSKRRGVKNPRALAAYIGDEKYGKEEMAKKSAESRLRNRKRH